MSVPQPETLLRKLKPLVEAQMERRAETVKTNVLARAMWRSSFYVQLSKTEAPRKVRRAMMDEFIDTPHGLTQVVRVDQYGPHLRFRLQLVDLTKL